MGEEAPRVVGRYALHAQIASGGMATVHLGRLVGPVGFARTVAIKRLHPWFSSDPEFVSMFLDEARLAARIRHPNVVPVLDVVAIEKELFLVMEYVQGEALSALMKACAHRGENIPVGVVLSIASGMLSGLHAAHEAGDETGRPLSIVHRDVSPQNLLVAADGVTRVVDFGVAKAANRIQSTKSGQVKGKLVYMAPEQIQAEPVDRRADIYAAAQVIWEMLTLRRLFSQDEAGAVVAQKLHGHIVPPSEIEPRVPSALDAVVMKGLAFLPENRFATAREMVQALQSAGQAATDFEVGEWVTSIAGDSLRSRARVIADVESAPAAAVRHEPSGFGAALTPSDSASPSTAGDPFAAATVVERVATQVSSISLVSDSAKRGSPSRVAVWAVPIGAAVGLAAAAGLLALRGGKSSDETAAEPPRASASSTRGPETAPIRAGAPELGSSTPPSASSGSPASSIPTPGVVRLPTGTPRARSPHRKPARGGKPLAPTPATDFDGLTRH